MDDLRIPPGPGCPCGLVVPTGELGERFSHASGPGGQGVNTADSRVQLSLDLATTTALAPKSFASQAMGLWWLSVATGQGVAGFIIAQTKDISDSTYYYGLGAATLLMALVLLVVTPWTQRKMADVGVASQD